VKVKKTSLGNTERAASSENDTGWTEVIQVLRRKVLERLPKAQSTQHLPGPKGHSLPHLPNVLAALLQSAFRPPLGTMADPHVSPIFGMQRLVGHAKLEIFHLLTTLRHLPMPIQRLELDA